MSKHTAGPWTATADQGSYVIKGDGWTVAEVYLAEDARLITAAPELLEELQYALDVSAAGLTLGETWQARARAAITKAKGEMK